MELVHVKSLPNASFSADCNGVYIATAINQTSVGVWSTQSLESKPLVLVGHKQPLTSVAFGKCHNPTALCTSAEDYVIVWNVEKARHLHETGQQIHGQVLVRRPGHVIHTCLSSDDTLVALCIDREVQIFDTQTQELHTTLAGHTAAVTCTEFCDHVSDTIITASEDRTFMIWDLQSSVLVYQSSIISAYPFVSLSVDPFGENLALGSTDGQVRVYDIRPGGGYKLLHQLAVDKLTHKHAARRKQASSAITGSSTSNQNGSCDDISANTSEAGEVVLALCFHHPNSRWRPRRKEISADNHLQPEEHVVDHLIEDSSMLLVGTPGSVVVIHTKSFEGSVISFQDPMPSRLGEEVMIPVASGCVFGSSPGDTRLWCITISAFQHSMEVMRLDIPDSLTLLSSEFNTHLQMNIETSSSEREISVIANVPLSDNSVLRSAMTPKATERKSGASTKSNAKSGKHIQDRPLTFQKKIKSSGYTDAPRMGMFSPKTKQGSLSSGKNKLQSSGGNRKLLKEFPMSSEPPNIKKQCLHLTGNSSAITDMHFSDDGQFLGCALGDKSAQVFKMPLTAGTSTCLTGHNSVLNTVHWSHDGAWLLTSSDDRTAKLWSRGGSDPVLTMGHLRNSKESTKPGPSGVRIKKDNPPFPHEVKHAQFYYIDKFIILASGSSFYLYKFNIDTSTDDIKRYETRSQYRLVKQYSMESANQLTCMSAPNGFHSHVVLCCGSDKSIQMFDLNVGTQVAVIAEAHNRCAHAIIQNLGSNYAGLGSSACNMFATSAITDGIKVWDVRTQRCVRKLEGHLNRAHCCGVKFSPCGRYLVSGSEDKAAYVFDLRKGSIFERLTGLTDVVISVDYHPLYHEIVTGSLDGKLHLFSDR